MYKIHICIPSGISNFKTELKEVLNRRKDGHKGFKRTLFHRLTIGKDTTIVLNFKDYVAKPDPDTGLFDAAKLLTVEENMAFLALINLAHTNVIDYLAMDDKYCVFFDMNDAPVPKEITAKVLNDLSTVEFKRHQPPNIFLPVINFTITEDDWLTDKALWIKLKLIWDYIYRLEYELSTKGGVEHLAKDSTNVLNDELGLFDQDLHNGVQTSSFRTIFYS